MNLKEFLLEDLITESINDTGILKSCFLAGNPGAGKSYVIKKIQDGAISPRVVNTDKFTEFYGSGGNTDWKALGTKTKQLTKAQLGLYVNSLLPLWIDGTSSNPSAVYRRKGILESIGFDTAMVWVNTSLETSLERNRNRKRVVPEEFVIDAYNTVQKLKPHYKSQFNNFFEVNNDVGELTDNVILTAYRKSSGYFNSPVKNPIGTMLIDKMKEKGYKYLIDNPEYDMQYIQKLLDSWYRK